MEYYCTATNPFGTIRSTTARAFYACKYAHINTQGKGEDDGTVYKHTYETVYRPYSFE